VQPPQPDNMGYSQNTQDLSDEELDRELRHILAYAEPADRHAEVMVPRTALRLMTALAGRLTDDRPVWQRAADAVGVAVAGALGLAAVAATSNYVLQHIDGPQGAKPGRPQVAAQQPPVARPVVDQAPPKTVATPRVTPKKTGAHRAPPSGDRALISLDLAQPGDLVTVGLGHSVTVVVALPVADSPRATVALNLPGRHAAPEPDENWLVTADVALGDTPIVQLRLVGGLGI